MNEKLTDKLIISDPNEEVFLTPEQGNFIKALIHKCCKCSQADYAESINMNKGLMSRYLTGEMRITLGALNKIVSNLNFTYQGEVFQYEALWRTIIEIRPKLIGQVVRPVDSIEDEET